MQCTHPIKLKLYDIEVPCRKCVACRIAHSREWAIRLLHESAYQKRSCFVTLTYREEMLPIGSGLDKKHLQDFMKRLRYACAGSVLRYFAVGDYGDQKGRPHYHVILFGLGIEDHTVDINFKGLLTGGPLHESWKAGNIWVGTVTPASIRYVTDYIFKAFDKEKAREVYGNKLAPFKLLSKGLGLEWVKDNQATLEDNFRVTEKGSILPLPRYYLDKMQGDKNAISEVRAVLRSRAKAVKLKKLSEQGIQGPVLREYLESSRKQRDLELKALARRKAERKGYL